MKYSLYLPFRFFVFYHDIHHMPSYTLAHFCDSCKYFIYIDSCRYFRICNAFLFEQVFRSSRFASCDRNKLSIFVFPTPFFLIKLLFLIQQFLFYYLQMNSQAMVMCFCFCRRQFLRLYYTIASQHNPRAFKKVIMLS